MKKYRALFSLKSGLPVESKVRLRRDHNNKTRTTGNIELLGTYNIYHDFVLHRKSQKMDYTQHIKTAWDERLGRPMQTDSE